MSFLFFFFFSMFPGWSGFGNDFFFLARGKRRKKNSMLVLMVMNGAEKSNQKKCDHETNRDSFRPRTPQAVRLAREPSSRAWPNRPRGITFLTLLSLVVLANHQIASSSSSLSSEDDIECVSRARERWVFAKTVKLEESKPR
jgi:hypothetical protein